MSDLLTAIGGAWCMCMLACVVTSQCAAPESVRSLLLGQNASLDRFINAYLSPVSLALVLTAMVCLKCSQKRLTLGKKFLLFYN